MFFQQTAAWAEGGGRAVASISKRFGAVGVVPDAFGLVMVRPGPGGRAEGFSHRGDWRCYPCSLVKSFHLVHALSALGAGRLQPDAELDRALADMITWSSNTATNYVIDLLTGTTGDTLLADDALAVWADRRDDLNRFFRGLGWPEFDGCTIIQKLMDDTRYGREAQLAGPSGERLNILSPLAVARLMWGLFEDDLPLPTAGRARAQAMLRRDPLGPDAAHPHYQLAGYLGANLPQGTAIWSKAGHNLWTGDARTSWFKHDMIRVECPGEPPLTIVLMTQGRAISDGNSDIFPEVGRMLVDVVADMDAGFAHAG